jgi:hypothetical protein
MTSRTNVRFILTNSIYTGWKIYDQRRDPSSRAYRGRPDGRQSDRPKIMRPESEIIRVRVLDGLVSEGDFSVVMQMVERKRRNNLRVRNQSAPRHVYSGFLICGDAQCGALIYTHNSNHDFYICKSHNTREKRKRVERGLEPCSNRYMLRKKLEERIDDLLGRKLTTGEFLKRIVQEYNDSLCSSEAAPALDQQNLEMKLDALVNKRERVLETYFEGVITKEDRDRRVAEIERETTAYKNLLMEAASAAPEREALNLETVLALITPFMEWEFLNREAKRHLLQLLCPEIYVYRYEITRIVLTLSGTVVDRDKGNRRRTARSQFPAQPCH